MAAGPSPTVAVLGAGSWGTALAMLLARNGVAVRLWDRDADHIGAMLRHRINQRYLPDIPLPDPVAPLAELDSALAGADFVLIVVPSAGFRSVLKQTRDAIGAAFNLIWASKGLEPGTGRFLHQVVEEELPGGTASAALSGPSFATEVARGLPTAVTVASQDSAYAQRVSELFHCAQFRTLLKHDLESIRHEVLSQSLAIAVDYCVDSLGQIASATKPIDAHDG
jgi:glycerol-3-phosphate dehydrogenase (NAD(P)+)